MFGFVNFVCFGKFPKFITLTVNRNRSAPLTILLQFFCPPVTTFSRGSASCSHENDRPYHRSGDWPHCPTGRRRNFASEASARPRLLIERFPARGRAQD